MDCKDPRPIIEKLLRPSLTKSSQALGSTVVPTWPNRELVVDNIGYTTTIVYSSGNTKDDIDVCTNILKKSKKVAKIIYVILTGHDIPSTPVSVFHGNSHLFTSFREFSHPKETSLFLEHLIALKSFTDVEIAQAVRSFLEGFRYINLDKLTPQDQMFWATVAQRPSIQQEHPSSEWHVHIFDGLIPIVDSDSRNIILEGSVIGHNLKYGLKTITQNVDGELNRLENLIYVDQVHTINISDFSPDEDDLT